jgi:hypothetical protein
MVAAASDKYMSKITNVVKQVLDREKKVVRKEGTNEIIPINKDTVFASKEVREAFCIAMMGPRTKGEPKAFFNVFGNDFKFLDSAYMVSPSPIITERLMHTALSCKA